MATDIRPLRPGRTALLMVIAVLRGVVITTGVFALLIVIFAAVRGGSVIDFVTEVFPRFRGESAGPARLPVIGYVMFFASTIMAALIAGLSRRR